MLRASRPVLHRLRHVRAVTMAATQAQRQEPVKKEGDISDAFVSLSGTERQPLPHRYLELKKSLVSGHEDRLIDSWKRLLKELKIETDFVAKHGLAVIPSIEFDDIESSLVSHSSEIRKRGVVVVRNVIPEMEARAYKDEIEEYVRHNPSTRAFPQNNPQVFELYWSGPQIKARAHPNLLAVQTALMHLWSSSDPESKISLSQPLAYADRLRIRQPGDANFALGPHIDGGSVERWEPHGYGRGGVYDKVFEGSWEDYDPWDASTRVAAVTNNYNGLGACSMFRMFQGWLSMSYTKPFEGTLMVNPLMQLSTTYLLLRPFFEPLKEVGQISMDEYLSVGNWRFTGSSMTSELQGATPGHGQELSSALHPHLELEKTMVHVPNIKPGDFVAWHCDTIHAVDQVHQGETDSSVLYIPVCPLTEQNAQYLKRQRAAFLNGTPGPDFPGGKGESEHVGRPNETYLHAHSTSQGLRAFGFDRIMPTGDDTNGARKAVALANSILGF